MTLLCAISAPEADRGVQEDKPEPLPVKRRKRVKKLKSKMYTTDDGAMGRYSDSYTHTM